MPLYTNPDLTGIEETLETLDTRVTTIESSIDTQNNFIGDYDSRITAIEAIDYNNLDSRLNALESSSGVDLTSINEAIQDHDQRLSALEGQDFALLETRVTSAENVNSSQASSISSLNTRITTLETSSSNIATKFIHFQDRKSDNTHGGSAVSGAWNVRVINTLVADATNSVSLSNNGFTLPAGTYYLQARVPFEWTARTRCRLRNTSDNTDIMYSNSSYFAGNSNAGEVEISGQFTIAANKILKIEYRCGTSQDTFGLGNATGFGSPYEIFTDIKLWKIG